MRLNVLGFKWSVLGQSYASQLDPPCGELRRPFLPFSSIVHVFLALEQADERRSFLSPPGLVQHMRQPLSTHPPFLLSCANVCRLAAAACMICKEPIAKQGAPLIYGCTNYHEHTCTALGTKNTWITVAESPSRGGPWTLGAGARRTRRRSTPRPGAQRPGGRPGRRAPPRPG